MYKNTLSALALATGLGIAMAQDAPAPAVEAVAAEAAVVAAEEEEALSPEKQAKIMKQMMEFEEACKAAGLDQMEQVPTPEQIKTFKGIIDSFLARTDLEEETLGQFLEMKVMIAILYAESVADIEQLKTDLDKLVEAYPAYAEELQQGLSQLFANGAEGLYNESQPMRDQMTAQAAMMEAAAATATPDAAPAAPAEAPAAE